MIRTLYLPRNNGGFISHYHHFLMGYFLPVLNEVPISLIRNTYFVDCGPMNTIVREFGFLLKDDTINEKGFDNIKEIKGLDGPEEAIPLELIETINSKVDQVLNIDSKKDHDPYILLIDRGPKVDIDQQIPELGGAHRRTILNMEEVKETLSEFGTVKTSILETLSFKDQVELFRNASCIVAQHGAGLSSMCFALRCKDLIEIVNTNNIVSSWFQNLADTMGIRRHLIVTTEAGDGTQMKNVTVDIQSLNSCMKLIFNGV